MELVVYGDAHALLALAHAEGTAQVHLLLQAVVGTWREPLIWQELPMHTVTFMILTS